jgi:hypothetical protein
MLSNTHWARIRTLTWRGSPIAKQHPKELKRGASLADDAAFSRTTSPITATHGDDPHGSSRILYRQVHAALKNGWLHRAHHQQAELQSKQATPILGEMITAAYALAAAAAEGRFPVKSVAEARGLALQIWRSARKSVRRSGLVGQTGADSCVS